MSTRPHLPSNKVSTSPRTLHWLLAGAFCAAFLAWSCDNAESNAATTPPALPAPTPALPALPALPAGLSWPAKVQSEMNTAVDLCKTDPVTAYLLFDDGLAGLLSEPIKDTGQRQWLESAAGTLRPYVRTLLDAQYRKCLTAEDLRGAAITREVISHIDGKLGEASTMLEPRHGWEEMDRLISRMLHAQGKSKDIWRLANVTGEHMPDFRETFGMMQSTYTPTNDRHDLLRIRAKATNVSTAGDPAYTTWVLPAAYRPFFRIDNPDASRVAGKRLASGRFLFVAAGDVTYPCGYVTRQASNILRGGGGFEALLFVSSAMIKKGIPPPGSYVSPGTDFDIDVLCSVPRDIQDPHLIFLGSAPVRVNITHGSQ